MRTIATALLAVSLSATAIPVAFASGYDIRSDVRQIERDRAQVRHEVREHDTAAVRQLDRKIERERADLRRDIAGHRDRY
jgi:hypothetical protein